MAKGKVRFFSEECKACVLCVHFCPKDVLGLDMNSINSLGYHPVADLLPDNCTGCGICALMCPDMVIVVERE
ncbi:MAG: 4Fe-4S binding protein [Firmicutes bacterium]|nr:4Fe-4S binding protein [Bacillota bacterium]